MTTLDELLSPEPTEQEKIIGNSCWITRQELVRATLQEAAKLVCVHCEKGQPLYRDAIGYYHQLDEGTFTSMKAQCLAPEIHARLAKEKP